MRTVPGNLGMNHRLGNECRGRGAEGRARRGTSVYVLSNATWPIGA